MTSHPRKERTIMNKLLGKLRTKRNRTIKFGQLTKYNVRNIFLQKSCGKCGRETSSKALSVFLKKLCIR